MKNKLLIDINSALSFYTLGQYSGIGRTTRELVQALNNYEGKIDFEISLFSQNTKNATGDLLNTRFKPAHLNFPNRPGFKKIFNYLPIKELFLNYDLMHIPHNADDIAIPKKTLLTIHDAMFFSYPEEFLGHAKARKTVPKLAQKCKGIVTCSEASKSDIVHYMQIPEEKVTVIPWGVDRTTFFHLDRKELIDLLQYTEIKKNYFLMVSCDIGRKNTLNVMRAFKALAKSEFQLVLIWQNPPKEILDEFNTLLEYKDIILLNKVSDEQLNALYNGAECSFFPSRYEGFGLPVLESFECGTPVVTCSNSSLKEVGGDAAIYVNPDQVSEMSEVMEAFVRGQVKREDYSEKVKLQAKKFDWNKVAKEYVDFYAKHLNV